MQSAHPQVDLGGGGPTGSSTKWVGCRFPRGGAGIVAPEFASELQWWCNFFFGSG